MSCWSPTRRALLAALALTLVSTTACSGFGFSTSGNVTPDHVEGIPDVVLQAYGQAAAAAEEIAPECTGMTWGLLAGIGHEESKHGVYYGGTVSTEGTVDPPIIGVALDGGVINDRGDTVQAIPDTDGGRYDRDTAWDRAVGPMQFIPATWDAWAPEANPDAPEPDPQNVFHATRTTVAYLCGHGKTDLTDASTLQQRIRAYNQSQRYVDAVVAKMEEYNAIPVGSEAAAGGEDAPDLTGIGSGAIGPCKETITPTSATPLSCASRDAAIRAFPDAQWAKAESAYCLRSTADDHGTGKACDLMTTEIGTAGSPEEDAAGDRLALWHITNHERLGVKYVIWKQSIWNPGWSSCPGYRPGAEARFPEWPNDVPDVPGGKWCGMPDRGSLTENHHDHVHISYVH